MTADDFFVAWSGDDGRYREVHFHGSFYRQACNFARNKSKDDGVLSAHLIACRGEAPVAHCAYYHGSRNGWEYLA